MLTDGAANSKGLEGIPEAGRGQVSNFGLLEMRNDLPDSNNGKLET